MTAESQLARILHLVPLASREGGASFDELTEALGVGRDRLLRDLEAVTGREYYHPAGTGGDIQVGLDGDRVRVWTTGPLQRPARLDLREAAALHFGLRLLAEERQDPGLPNALRDLTERIAWSVPDDAGEAVVAGDPGDRDDALRAVLVDAARRRRRVVMQYLKPDAPDVEARTVDPYVLAHAEGHAYVIGRDDARDEVRVFRLDRVLEARPGEATFTVPDGFDPADYFDGGRVHRADDEIRVTVRYGPGVARWIAERGQGEVREDGSVVVTHTVSDPGWIVRHVLRYGAEAEVVGPEEVREAVRRVLGDVGDFGDVGNVGDVGEAPLAREGA